MVNIVGAGLAGLSCAIKLAQNGQDVQVFEKNDFIYKNVGENIQAMRNYEKNLDQLEFFREQGLNLNNFNPIHRIIKYSPSGKKMEIFSEDKPLFYSIKRGPREGSVDYQLYDQAVKEGVKIYFNHRKSVLDGDVISVGGIYTNIWAYGREFKGYVDPHTIHFFLNNDYCPQGYIYLVPFGDTSFTLASTSFDLTAPLPTLFEKFIDETPYIKELVDDAKFSHGFRGFAYTNIPQTLEIENKKFIGGAGGLIDPARGFGTRYAIESGLLCAQSIIGNQSYDSLWKTSFEKEFVKSFGRKILFERMTNKDYDLLLSDGKIPVNRYEKLPDFLREMFLGIEISLSLADSRRKYDLRRLLKQKEFMRKNGESEKIKNEIKE